MSFKHIYFSKIKEKLNNFLFFLSKNTIFFIIFFSSIIAVFFSCFFYFRSPRYVVLYDNLSVLESSSMISKLKKIEIPYKFNYSTGSLLVPVNKLHESRFILSKKNIPKTINNGYKLLDNESFGISQFNEKINYQRALEGELSQTLRHIYPIKNARIHLVFSKDSDFLHKKTKPSASVFLELYPKINLNLLQINAITNLISYSIPDLQSKDVVLIDQFGNLLNKNYFKKNIIFDSFKFKYKNFLEKQYINRIKKVLNNILGKENFSINVDVKLEKNKNFILKNKKKYNSDIYFNKKSRYFFHKKNILNNDSNFKSLFKNNLNKNLKFDKNINNNRKNKYFIKKINVFLLVNFFKNKSNVYKPISLKKIKILKSIVKSIINYSIKRNDHISIKNFVFDKVINKNDIYKNFFIKYKKILTNYKKNYFLFFLYFLIFILFIGSSYLFYKYFSFKKNILFNKNKDSENISKYLDKKHFDLKNNNNEKDKNNVKSCLKNNFLLNNKILLNDINQKLIVKVIRKWMNEK